MCDVRSNNPSPRFQQRFEAFCTVLAETLKAAARKELNQANELNQSTQPRPDQLPNSGPTSIGEVTEATKAAVENSQIQQSAEAAQADGQQQQQHVEQVIGEQQDQQKSPVHLPTPENCQVHALVRFLREVLASMEAEEETADGQTDQQHQQGQGQQHPEDSAELCARWAALLRDSAAPFDPRMHCSECRGQMLHL